MTGVEKELRRILDSRDPPEVQHLVVAVSLNRVGVKAGKINTLLQASLYLQKGPMCTPETPLYGDKRAI